MPARVPETPSCGPPPSADAVRLCLGRLSSGSVRAYRLELGRCRSRMSRESVHALRIAIRRLLVCLRLVGAAQKETAGVGAQLRLQLKALGALRDTQVQIQLTKKGSFRHAPELKPLREHLRRKKRRRMKAAARVLDSDKVVHCLQWWRPRLKGEGPRILPRLRRLVDGKIRDAIGSLAAVSGPEPADSKALHRSRRLSRECCYVVEALRPCWRGDRADELLSILRAHQQGVGRRRDRELLLRRMVRLVKDGELQAAPSRLLGETLLSRETKRETSASLREWRTVLEALLARRDDLSHWPGR